MLETRSTLQPAAASFSTGQNALHEACFREIITVSVLRIGCFQAVAVPFAEPEITAGIV
jgi:hypothetical protein